MRQRIRDRGGRQIKTAEQLAAQANQLVDRENGKMLVADDFLNDRGGRTVPAVGHNTDDIAQQIQTTGHQHGRGAHGHPVQKGLRVRAEAFDGIVHPRAAVIALQDAEGKALTLAFAVRPLVDEQHVEPIVHRDLQATAEVPLRAAL